jgi:hypothetical protein
MTISVDSSAAVRPPAAPRRLGELLVGRGLLTAAQLQEALVEQQRTGIPLGQVVVQRGYTTPAAVAQALATQQGGVAKSEFGMAIGFDTELGSEAMGPPPVSVRPAREAGLASREEPAGPSYSELQARVRAADEQLDTMADQMVETARRLVATEIDRDRERQRAADLQRENDRLTNLLAVTTQRCA